MHANGRYGGGGSCSANDRWNYLKKGWRFELLACEGVECDFGNAGRFSGKCLGKLFLDGKVEVFEKFKEGVYNFVNIFH